MISFKHLIIKSQNGAGVLERSRGILKALVVESGRADVPTNELTTPAAPVTVVKGEGSLDYWRVGDENGGATGMTRSLEREWVKMRSTVCSSLRRIGKELGQEKTGG